MIHTLDIRTPPRRLHGHPDNAGEHIGRGPIRTRPEELRCRTCLDAHQESDLDAPGDHPGDRPRTDTGPLSGLLAGRSGDQPGTPVHRLDQRLQDHPPGAEPISPPQLLLQRLVHTCEGGVLVDDDDPAARDPAPPTRMNSEPTGTDPASCTLATVGGPPTLPRDWRSVRRLRSRCSVWCVRISARRGYSGHAKAPLLFAGSWEPPRYAGAPTSPRVARPG